MGLPPRCCLGNLEGNVARENSARGGDLDCAGGSAGGDSGGDLARSDHGESCGRAVERDCGSSGQVHSQDDNFCANGAGRGQRSDERRRSDIEFENGAVILGATFAGRAVNVSIGGLQESGVGTRAIGARVHRAESVDRRERALRANLVDGSAERLATPHECGFPRRDQRHRN